MTAYIYCYTCELYLHSAISVFRCMRAKPKHDVHYLRGLVELESGREVEVEGGA